MAATTYLVIEQFKQGAEPVYRRMRERGRMAPEGLTYAGSWIDASVTRCWQITSAAAAARVLTNA